MHPVLQRVAVIVPAALLLAMTGATPAYAGTTTITGAPNPTTATTGTTVSMSDTVTLTGSTHAPTGDVHFNFFDNDTCTGPEEFGGTVALTPGAGLSSTATFTNPSWTVGPAGNYYWRAAYSTPDVNNEVAFTACNDAAQRVVVSPATPVKATPDLTGNASPEEVVDGVEVTVTNVATFTGANAPTGFVYFGLFDNDLCDGDAVFEDEAPISGNTATLVADITPDGAGTYFWAVYYEGDAQNEEAGSCGGPNQLLMVALNPDLEPQQPGPLTPVAEDGDGEVTVNELPATGPAPVLELTLLSLGLLLLGTSAVGVGRTRRSIRA